MGELLHNYYTILNVTPESSMIEIKKSYRKLVLKYHPDVNKDPEAEEKFKKITKAFSILSNPKTRLKYDIVMENEYKWKVDRPGIKDYLQKINFSLKSGLVKRNGKFSFKDTIKVDEYTLNLSSNELLKRIEESSNSYVKKVAILSLIEKNLNTSYIYLIKSLKTETDTEIILFYLNSMIEKYGKKFIYDIYFLQEHENQDVILSLISICNDYPNAKSSEMIKKFMYHKNPVIRLKALDAAYSSDRKLLMDNIYNLLNDSDIRVKNQAKKIYDEIKKTMTEHI